MLSEYPFFPDFTLPDQHRLTALEGQGVLPQETLETIHRASSWPAGEGVL